MAGSRGYRSYRGKGSKKKIVLAVVLLLVILAALGVVLVQEHIVYDGNGAPRLEVPWQEEQVQEPEETVELDLVIQPAETREVFHGYMFPPMPLYVENCQAVLREDSPWNAAVLVLKDSSGTVYYDSAAARYNAANVAEEADEVIRSLTETERLHTIAKIGCFHDPKAANADVEGMGLKNTGGYIFYDGNNSQWLDPAKPAARQYLCALAEEAAELGFREILLTDVSYPTEGKVDKIAYGEGTRQEHLRAFLQEMRATLEPYEVKLSIEVPADVLLAGENELSGLMPDGFVPEVDCVYAAVLPEQMETCEAAVSAADEETRFIPLLESAAEDLESYLIQ